MSSVYLKKEKEIEREKVNAAYKTYDSNIFGCWFWYNIYIFYHIFKSIFVLNFYLFIKQKPIYTYRNIWFNLTCQISENF